MESKTYSGAPSDWLWETSATEATCRSVSVGGLAAELGMLDKDLWVGQPTVADALAGAPAVAPLAK